MKTRLANLWEALRANYWFLPALMALASAGLAFGLLALDVSLEEHEGELARVIYRGGAEGARLVLSTIASSMITVAGVVFSIMIAALSLASQQFGPRLLRNFLRDRADQVSLGVFTATFLYCLIVLGSIQRVEEDEHFVPVVAVTGGLVLAVLSVGTLIYFINHAAQSIQVSSIAATVGRELEELIASLPERDNRLAAREAWEPGPAVQGGFCTVVAAKMGYVGAVDTGALIRLAEESDVLIRIDTRAGDFVVKGSRLATIWPENGWRSKLSDAINDAVIVGKHRTQVQDLRFGFRQLVDIAVRALSPSMNDPFTAMMCIDWLGGALCQLAGRTLPAAYAYDKHNRLRLILTPETFDEIVETTFGSIRQYSSGHVLVTLRLLEATAGLMAFIETEDQRHLLLRQAGMIERAVRDRGYDPHDRQRVAERYDAVVAASLRR